MNAVSLIGVVSAFGLVFLWLLALCAEKGIHPPSRVRDGFGRLPVWEKMLLSLFVGAWLVFASEKNDGTNGVNQVEGDTNMVMQVEGGTNQMENGELRIDNAGGNFSILRSPFSILHSNAALPGNAITGDDVERMFRVATTFDGNLFAEPTANAVTNAAWLDYGGMSDTFRLLPEGWRFPHGSATANGLTVFENGEIRPNVKTHFFPPPFDAKLSLLPRMNWGLLPNGGESACQM